jgi:hypothetical protein
VAAVWRFLGMTQAFTASGVPMFTGVKLMDQLKAEVVEAVAILELQELEGRKKLPNTPLHALAVVSEYGEPGRPCNVLPAWLRLLQT